MRQPELIQRELTAARAAWAAGHEGKARVCARRVVALADEAWLARQSRPPWTGDAMAHLRRIHENELLPVLVRQAAERLTTAVTRQQTAPFTTNPISDAKIILECVMPIGETAL